MIDGVPTTAFGALAALSLGLTDVLARFTTGRLGPITAGAVMYGGGAVILTIVAATTGAALPGSPLEWASALGSGLCGGLGILCFYMAIARGQLGFVIPIAASYPVWSVLYSALRQGAEFSPALLAAIAATILGALVVARFGALHAVRPASATERVGVALLALAGSVLFTASLYVAEPAVSGNGAITTLAIARATGFVLMAAAAPRFEPRPTKGAVLGAAAALVMATLDGLATLLILLVIVRADNALAVVVSGAFGVVTVVLGRLLLGERINPMQWGGIALALGGAAAVSAVGA